MIMLSDMCIYLPLAQLCFVSANHFCMLVCTVLVTVRESKFAIGARK